MSTFVVGIDLGTTNSALASVPVASERPEIDPVPIPQVVAPGEVDERATLPSFLLLPTRVSPAW